MPKPTEEALSKQRTAHINTLVGYLEALVCDRVALQVEEVYANLNRTQVNAKLKEELTERIQEARASIRSTLDLLLP
jgi:selenocysteine lyase/cysteine desulfurase